ncbi:MAG: hypothetical protein NVSMB2_26860 [Chloroflexota bacterium]
MRFPISFRPVALAVLGVTAVVALIVGCIALPGRSRAQTAAACDDGAPYAEVQSDAAPRIDLELAQTPQEHEIGLMDRSSLPVDSGMLFIYQYEARDAYWMFHTLIPLSIAWIDRSGTIVDIQDMPRLGDPFDRVEAGQHVYAPAAPYWYALEVNRGWFSDNGVSVGQRVTFCLGS